MRRIRRSLLIAALGVALAALFSMLTHDSPNTPSREQATPIKSMKGSTGQANIDTEHDEISLPPTRPESSPGEPPVPNDPGNATLIVVRRLVADLAAELSTERSVLWDPELLAKGDLLRSMKVVPPDGSPIQLHALEVILQTEGEPAARAVIDCANQETSLQVPARLIYLLGASSAPGARRELLMRATDYRNPRLVEAALCALVVGPRRTGESILWSADIAKPWEGIDESSQTPWFAPEATAAASAASLADDARAVLYASLAQDRPPSVRLLALSLLHDVNASPDLAGLLLVALPTAEGSIRERICGILWASDDVGSQDRVLREGPLAALPTLASPTVVRSIAATYEREADVNRQARLLDLLPDSDQSGESHRLLESALAAPSPIVRTAAIHAARRYYEVVNANMISPSPRLLRQLEGLLNDAEVQVRVSAAEALGARGSAQQMPALERLTAARCGPDAAAAQLALEEIERRTNGR